MELLVCSILVVLTLIGPNVDGRVVEYSSTNQPGVTYGQFVGNASNAEAADCECYNGKCEMDEYGEFVCVCPPEHGPVFEGRPVRRCYSCHCGEGNNCTYSHNQYIMYLKECLCKEGYKDVRGTCKDKCEDKCGDDYAAAEITCTVDSKEVTCTCKDQDQLFDYYKKNCRAKTACDYDEAIKKCQANNAKCALDAASRPDGYVCNCNDGFVNRNGICVDKCKEKCGDDYAAAKITCKVDTEEVTCTCKDQGQFDYDARNCRFKRF